LLDYGSEKNAVIINSLSAFRLLLQLRWELHEILKLTKENAKPENSLFYIQFYPLSGL